MVALTNIFKNVSTSMPSALNDWERRVDSWCSEYRNQSGQSELTEIIIDQAVFIFDLIAERVVLAYSISTKQLCKRDSNRISGFHNVNASTKVRSVKINLNPIRGTFLDMQVGES